MKKPTPAIIALAAAGLAFGLHPNRCDAQSHAIQGSLSDLTVAKDETQQALTEDVVDGFKQLDMGLRWLSAEALARYGVKSVLRKLKLN